VRAPCLGAKLFVMSVRLRDREAGYAKKAACGFIWSNALACLYGPGPAKSFLLMVTPTE
jgi:hypothetical protein